MITDIKQSLATLNTDYSGALERVAGNEALYHKLLVQFLKDPNFNGLKTSLERNDISSAFQYAHTFRGVVGNLGLNLLYDTTRPLVELLRKEQLEETKELMTILEHDYQKLCKLIQDLLLD